MTEEENGVIQSNRNRTRRAHPDAENHRRLEKILNLDRGRTKISLIPRKGEMLEIEGYEFDIEMPTFPWHIGYLKMRNGRYECMPGTPGEWNRELDLFYGRQTDGRITEEMMFNGKHMRK